MAGMVYLYDKDEEIVTAKSYDYQMDRKNIIEGWRRMYAAAFKNCYIQIAPNANPKAIHEDGTNKKYFDRASSVK